MRGCPISLTFDAEQVRAYARATADDNPIHLSDEAARAAGLAGAIVHGMLPVAHVLERVRASHGGLIGLEDVRFRRPIRVGVPVTLELTPAGDGQVGFAFACEDGTATTGTLRLEGPS